MSHLSTQDFLSHYGEATSISEVKKGRILQVLDPCRKGEKQALSIQIQWECRDLVSQKRQKSDTHYIFQDEKVMTFPSAPLPNDVILQDISPEGNKVAQIIQNEVDSKLMISEADGRFKMIDLKLKNLHGKVYADPYISSIDWSQDQRKVAFIAERKTPLRSTFFSPSDDKEGVGEKHKYTEDWGEQMQGQHEGVLVTVDIEKEEMKILELPRGITPGQIAWRPNSNCIVGVGYPSHPFRIGIAYCSDRESFLFQISEEGMYEELTPRKEHVKNPRFSPSGKKLVYLQSSIYGSRAPTARLMLMQWPSKQATVQLDYVEDRIILESVDYMSLDSSLEKNDRESFYGVCGKTSLPKRCFEPGEQSVWFSAFKSSNFVAYQFALDLKCVKAVIDDPGYNLILDVQDQWILLLRSCLTQPDRIYVCRRDSKASFGSVSMNPHPITPSRRLIGVERDWFSLFAFESPISDREGKKLRPSALYIGPPHSDKGRNEPRPLICWCHGGPHSTIANRFSHVFYFLLQIGYSIVLPNYRGSVGHGGDFFTASLGQCGEADVEDCFQSIQECIRRHADEILRDKIFLAGFSHGGFLAIHLSARHSDFFKATVVMNPVTDVYTMASASDIPEWAYLEFGLSFSLGQNLDPESVSRMFARSPIRFAQDVKTPTLFLLGKEDVRVPPQQSLNFHRMLLARNIPTKVYAYNDDHPLLKISSESDYVIQMAKWFQEHGH